MSPPERAENPRRAATMPTSRFPWLLLWGVVFAILANSAWPVAGAVPLPTSPSADVSLGTPATGQWAWGAFENATFQTESLGGYTDGFNLSNGSLSQSRALVDEVMGLHAELGSFAVVNATAPTPGTRHLEARAVSIANYTGLVEVAGMLPVAGTYAPGAPVTLANASGAFYASIITVSAYTVFANYTYANGTIGLLNEHVAAWTGIKGTTVAYQWPVFTLDTNGTATVTYRTAAAVALGWVAEAFTASFTPALTLAKAPLVVGKTWNSTTQANVAGWAVYASVAAYRSGSANSTTASSEGTSLNATATLTVNFQVIGSQRVVFPNGTSATADTIRTAVNGPSAATYVLWDGLVVLPTSGVAPSTPLHPAEPLATAEPGTATPGTPTEAVVASSGFPVATSEAVPTGGTLATAPLPLDRASRQISAAGTPARPTAAIVPAQDGPPTLTSPSGAPPTRSSPPTTPPGQTKPGPSAPSHTDPAKSGIDPFMLVALLAGIALVFLCLEVGRQRRRA